MKKLESKIFKNETHVRANVLHSIKKTPYRVVLDFSPTCDVLRAVCKYLTGLNLRGKGKCNHIGGVLLAIEVFIYFFFLSKHISNVFMYTFLLLSTYVKYVELKIPLKIDEKK